jgi:ABC-type dipeptide/oligopeptide/nickel transport system permease subunit
MPADPRIDRLDGPLKDPLADPSSEIEPGAGLPARSPMMDDPIVEAEPGVDYEVGLESLGQWQIAWRKFKRHRLAMVGLIILGMLVAGAIIVPIFLPFDFQKVPNPDVIVPKGRPPSLLWSPPSTAHVFGETGGLQRDIWELVWNGARTSLFVGFSSMIIGVVLGTIVGTVAGFFGGVTDNLLMRVVDVMLSLPLLFVILVASRFFGNGSPILIVLIFGFFSWMGVSRLVRSLFLSLREQDFVEAARAVGVSERRIAFRHILPNAVSPIVVVASLIVAGNIIAEAFVSFLGFGISTLTPTWGNILTNALTFIPQGNWWWPFFPGFAIVLTVLAVNFIGDGLRDALDPRSRV